MARRRVLDDDGFERIPGLKEVIQIRDGMGKTQLSTNFIITGNPKPTLTEGADLDPSLSTFRVGIRHWSRFESVYRQVEQMKRRNPTRTAPELLTSLLMTKWGIDHIDQVSTGGGKLRKGGGLLDFIIPSRGFALNVHGAYFHGQNEARTEWVGLVGQYAAGIEIKEYSYIFDDDLYRGDDGIYLRYVLSGIRVNQ